MYPIKPRMILRRIKLLSRVPRLSNSQSPRKFGLIIVCVVVLFLLAPYAGCGVGFLRNSSRIPVEDPIQSDTSNPKDQEDPETSATEKREPLGQIEDLLSQ